MTDFIREFRRQTENDPTWCAILVGAALILAEVGVGFIWLTWVMFLR